MKQRKLNKRKGFTLVELLVVIAILAVLATVSVVGYTSFTKKAKVSNDVSLTTQMNTILQANEVTDGKNATPHEAVEELVAGGLDVTKLTPTANGYSYVYDLDTNRMVLVDEKMNVISPDKSTFANKLNVFAFVEKESELEEAKYAGYSFYLKNNFESDDDVTVKTGVDTGNNNINKLTYTNTTSTAQNVVIRTNGGTLEVNAPLDTVEHFAKADKVVITAVAGNSYHENGEIAGNIEIASGRVEVAEKAEVSSILVTGNDVKIELKDNKVETKIMVSNTVDADHQPEVIGKEFNAEESKITLVNSFDELKNAFTKKGNIVLGNDIKANSGSRYQLKVQGGIEVTMDLNGHTITGCTSVASFGIKGKLTINGNGKVLTTSQLYSLFYVYEYSNARGELVINGGTYEHLRINTASNKSVQPLIKIGDESYKEDATNKDGTPDTDYKGGIVTINGGTFISREFCVGVMSKGELTINGGTFTSLNNAVVGTLGTKGLGGNNITINGGTFNANIIDEGYIACGVYLANADTLTVNGGIFNINNGCGILVRSGNATIGENVEINLNIDGTILSGKVGDSNINVDINAFIVMDERSGYPGGAPSIANNSNYQMQVISD